MELTKGISRRKLRKARPQGQCTGFTIIISDHKEQGKGCGTEATIPC
jgi:hypothetical protein